MSTQTNFDAFAKEQKLREEEPDPWEFDEYGPTMNEPLPIEEEEQAMFESGGEMIDRREIPDSGLSLSDITDWPYINREEDRPERIEQWAEKAAKFGDQPGGQEVAADGGTVQQADIPQADPNNPPTNEKVLLIMGITRVSHSPSIIEGETSGTGKTISVNNEKYSISARLDASEIFAGNSEFRDSRYFEIYTPARMRSNQRANYAPGPQAGANKVRDADELPEPTHWPTLDEPDDAPEECPECGQTSAPWKDARDPVCEACGYMHEEEEEEPEESGDDVEKPGFQDLEYGDTLIIDGYRGEFVITKVSTMIGTDTTNYLEAARRDGREWSQVKIQNGSPYEDRKLKVNEDNEVSIGINVNSSELAQDFEVTGNDKERVRRYIRDKRK